MAAITSTAARGIRLFSHSGTPVTFHWRQHPTLSFALCFVLTLLCSCSGRKGLLPESGGRPFEVLVVDDRDSLVKQALSVDMLGLPQPEPWFDVSSVDSAHFFGSLLLARAIVKVRIDPNVYTGVRLRYERNVHAQPQIIVHLGAPSVKALREELNREDSARVHDDGSWEIVKAPAQQLRDLLCRAELGHQIALLRHHRNIKAEQQVRKMFGIDLWIPADMVASKKGKDFIWLSNNSATEMSNIVIYRDWNKFRAPDGRLYYYDNEPKLFVDARNYMLGHNILGETDSMHMSTVRWSVHVSMEKQRGSRLPVYWYRGLWEMTGDDMGGPFVSTRLPLNNPVPWVGDYSCQNIVAEGFVFAPGRKKRNAMRRLEAALRTLKFHKQETTKKTK